MQLLYLRTGIFTNLETAFSQPPPYYRRASIYALFFFNFLFASLIFAPLLKSQQIHPMLPSFHRQVAVSYEERRFRERHERTREPMTSYTNLLILVSKAKMKALISTSYSVSFSPRNFSNLGRPDQLPSILALFRHPAGFCFSLHRSPLTLNYHS
ncbi:uncharacterized protein CLUP02_12589 [Colletotrichum lupini]|uniref:Transmembrane protein n=1 Tax=Colletotrichum lupini TaxID=145971 RepID=A0A9Q8T0U8_9PEZI|nr:uncharacterized protein CLUP02_12589 [Colletotrichum lupini]UQC87087.1 hypothetical protein CLUP02_12589 [Colletotrichum lupini]